MAARGAGPVDRASAVHHRMALCAAWLAMTTRMAWLICHWAAAPLFPSPADHGNGPWLHACSGAAARGGVTHLISGWCISASLTLCVATGLGCLACWAAKLRGAAARGRWPRVQFARLRPGARCNVSHLRRFRPFRLRKKQHWRMHPSYEPGSLALGSKNAAASSRATILARDYCTMRERDARAYTYTRSTYTSRLMC